jgi:hypothetical protein
MNPKDNPSCITRRIDNLLNRHKKAWAELKTGDIQIEGDLDAQQRVRFACIICILIYARKPDRALLQWVVFSRIQWTYFWDSEFGCTQHFFSIHLIWQNHV